jgi:opacity protein-like surface antigen
MRTVLFFSALFLYFLSSPSFAQLSVTVESGVAFNGSNDVRYFNEEGNKGDLFSLTDDFTPQQSQLYARIEVQFRFLEKNIIELTAAPLAFDYEKNSGTSIQFGENEYGLSGNTVTGRYEFNTYRASYRYQFIDTEKWNLSAGATVLVRDARIALSENGIEDETTDLGVVPLLSFDGRYKYSENLEFLLKGDALVGPQGRAEDVLLGLQYKFKADGLSARAGYRIIDGGANVSQVYNFALIHFASVGLQYKFKR